MAVGQFFVNGIDLFLKRIERCFGFDGDRAKALEFSLSLSVVFGLIGDQVS